MNHLGAGGGTGGSKNLKVAEKKFNSLVKKSFGNFQVFAAPSAPTCPQIFNSTIE
jgi:hypothetical protein